MIISAKKNLTSSEYANFLILKEVSLAKRKTAKKVAIVKENGSLYVKFYFRNGKTEKISIKSLA